ncbi:polysaccharide deacetylase family protein [Herbidospora mongoliensis]|uniref:polysaccharide deacetylase family protein n=1 Tax=Herbidospora mongoliensis TaxID=688067 RepID=UPI000829AB0F|nr:polysaccharide deacetylase family protein [Herbidospora mongoliensis]
MRVIVRGALALVLTTSLLAPAASANAKVKPYCERYKCIALTFDDGPWPYTPALLDTLKKHKAKATFFVLGRKVESRADMMKRMVDEGHEIGNHTWDHPDLTKLSDEEIMAEIAGTQQIIQETAGITPTFMRPPNGATNSRVGSLMKSLGLPQILWTGSTLDWQARDTKVIKERTLKFAKRDAVILLHDIVPETVKAMETVVDTLTKKGYKLVTVSTILGDRVLKPGEAWPKPPKKK